MLIFFGVQDFSLNFTTNNILFIYILYLQNKVMFVKGTITKKFFFGRATMNFNTAKQIATILNNKNGQLVLNDE